MRKPEIVIILESHPLEDGRIQKHIRFLLEEKFDVVRIHFTPYHNPDGLKEGSFSQFGEKSFNINLNWQITLKGLRLLNYFSLFMPGLVSRVIDALNSRGVSQDAVGILHVHDPILLPLTKKLQRTLLKNSKIVYDRHELYEKMKRFGNVGGYRLFEKLAAESVSGIVVVSDSSKLSVSRMFPNASIASVPNFPLKTLINEKKVTDKIKNFSNSSTIHCIYIGSLRRNLDRDIELLLKIAEEVLLRIPASKFYIGGESHDEDLITRFHDLQEKFSSRFTFLGVVPYEKVLELTQDAHIGFFLIKPDTSYWVPCSPNKVFEYLSCGVIPVVRAECDFRQEMDSCGLFFDRTTDERVIIESLLAILSEPKEMKARMEQCAKNGRMFSYQSVAVNYLRLYDSII